MNWTKTASTYFNIINITQKSALGKFYSAAFLSLNLLNVYLFYYEKIGHVDPSIAKSFMPLFFDRIYLISNYSLYAEGRTHLEYYLMIFV